MPNSKRGRPIQYDPDTALARARDVFWASGFAASSLDALSAATGMNRPSLFNAFGDKEALYIATLERYRDDSAAALREMLSGNRPVRAELTAVYAKSIDLYLAAPEAAQGCLLIGTASVEAVQRPEIREILGKSLTLFTAILEERFRKAITTGEIERSADAVTCAGLASAVLHSLAVRARAGEKRAELEKLARNTVALLCGPGKKKVSG
jgi:TetR/AcrR family transcriptional regulator, copper-responsive repressor